MTTTTQPGVELSSPSRRKVLLATAWAFVLLCTLAPHIVLEEVFGISPVWWLSRVQIGVALGFVALTFADRFRPLRTFALALLAAQGAWNVSNTWLGIVGITDLRGASFTLATELLQGIFVVALLAVLVASGTSHERLFLQTGRPAATTKREWLPGFRRERPWWKVALLWGGVPGATLIAVNASAGYYPVDRNAETLAVAVPMIVVAAALNAFAEEFVYRAAPLASLVETFGERHALVLLGGFFGLSHYYGSPGGLTGVAMTAFFGWLLAKSILETRGLGVAFAIHVAADIIIFATFI